MSHPNDPRTDEEIARRLVQDLTDVRRRMALRAQRTLPEAPIARARTAAAHDDNVERR